MDFTVFGIHIFFSWRYLVFVWELMAAELMFLFFFKKRPLFLLRLAGAVVLLCLYRVVFQSLERPLIGALTPLLGEMGSRSLCNLLLYLSLLVLSIFCMKIPFSAPLGMITAACTAGYATIHISYKLYDILRAALPVSEWVSDPVQARFLLEIPCIAVTYILVWIIFARQGRKYAETPGDPMLRFIAAAIVVFGIGINCLSVDFGPRDLMRTVSDSLYGMTSSVFALIIQYYIYSRQIDRSEMDLTRALMREQSKQYESWKAALGSINEKYHDLRHELNTLKAASDNPASTESYRRIVEMVDESFSIIHTGNEMLDVLLTQKMRECETNKIMFTCTADGDALDRNSDTELFSLFVNALDNAIAASRSIPDEGKRIISLNIRRLGGFVDIHLQNYYGSTIEMVNGLPVSTQEPEGHGYGMKSMKKIAEQLGGTMSVHLEDGLFHLQFVIPG